MKNLPAWLFVLLITFAFIHTSFQSLHQPVIIKGSVVANDAGTPVADAYIYTLAGEEEAITGQDGNFTLKTWQSFPVRCTVDHKHFWRQIVLVKQAGTVLVKLQPK